MRGHFLAVDLGAESGRTILGRLNSGVLTLTEVRRFPNEPVRQAGTLRWDILRLWHEIKNGLDRAGTRLDSVGVDTWGCDYGLIGESGQLLENPYHYRDTRTDGVMDAVFQRVPRDEIYRTTGIQFLTFNTLYQLYAQCQSAPVLIDAANALVTIPDLFNYWLTGRLCSEFTIASTTQFTDARTRSWATGLLSQLDIPPKLLLPLVEAGTVLGQIGRDVSSAHSGTPVVATAGHDTAAAFASVCAGGDRAFLSSGTWSLLGTEVTEPIVSSKACELNFTNEGGVCGTTRLLKNIGGLWLLQSCRRGWAEAGQHFAYDDLLEAAGDDRHAFQALFDPDHSAFFHPEDMAGAIADYCRLTGQHVPEGPPGYTRSILESLACKYRQVLESLEELTGNRYTQIRIVGGGSRNRLLNQFTADVTGRTVVAGPVEATALGNIAMQMLATGAVSSLGEARQVIDRSFPVERFEPSNADRWDAHYQHFQEYVEVMRV